MHVAPINEQTVLGLESQEEEVIKGKARKGELMKLYYNFNKINNNNKLIEKKQLRIEQ